MRANTLRDGWAGLPEAPGCDEEDGTLVLTCSKPPDLAGRCPSGAKYCGSRRPRADQALPALPAGGSDKSPGLAGHAIANVFTTPAFSCTL